MKPEEKIRRLRDEELWNEIRIPRGAAIPRARAWRLLVTVVASLAIAALLIMGVNLWRGTTGQNPAVITPLPSEVHTTEPVPSQTPSASSTPHSSATPTTPPPKMTNTPPTQLFGGKCENVLPTSEVNQIVGTKMSDNPTTLAEVLGEYNGKLTSADGFITRQIGGLNCAWFSNKTGSLINLTLVPASRVTPLSSPELCARDIGGWSGCTTDIVRYGVRVTGAVGQTGGPEDLRITKALMQRIESRLSHATMVTGRSQSAVDWPLPVDCSKLSEKTGLHASNSTGGDNSAAGMYAALVGKGQPLRCDWSSGIAEYRPGGAWAEEQIAETPGAEEIHVSGFDHVIKVTTSGQDTYNFFRGTNWLIVNQLPKSQSAIIGFATTVADGLDQL